MFSLSLCVYLLQWHRGQLGGRRSGHRQVWTRQRNVGQPSLPAAAVVGDLKGAALVVVQAASCRGSASGEPTSSSTSASVSPRRLRTFTLEALPHQAPQHLAAVVAERRRLVGVNVERVRPNLEVFLLGER